VEEALEAVRLATERLAAGAGTQLDVLKRAGSIDHRAQHGASSARELQLPPSPSSTASRRPIPSMAETFHDPLAKRRPPKTRQRMLRPKPARQRKRRDHSEPGVSVALPIERFPALAALSALTHGFLGRIPGIDVKVDRESALQQLDGFSQDRPRKSLAWRAGIS